MKKFKLKRRCGVMDEFKPCPFCGGKAKIVDGGTEYDGRKWCKMEYIECQKCYMRSPSLEIDGNDNMKYFLDLWNTRTPQKILKGDDE